MEHLKQDPTLEGASLTSVDSSVKVEGKPKALRKLDLELEALKKRDAERELELAELRAMVRGKDEQVEMAEDKEQRQVCKLVFHDDLPVVGFGEVRRLPNGEESVRLTVRLADGSEEPRELDYSKLMQESPRYVAEILTLTKRTQRKSQRRGHMEYAAGGRYGNMSDKQRYQELMKLRIPLMHDVMTTKARIRFLEGPWEGKEIEVDADACHNK